MSENNVYYYLEQIEKLGADNERLSRELVDAKNEINCLERELQEAWGEIKAVERDRRDF